MRGEENAEQLYLDLLRERNPRLKDVMAEREGHKKAIFNNAAAVPVDEREQARNRELFLHESARSSPSSAASVEREESETRQRIKQRNLFYGIQGPGGVGHFETLSAHNRKAAGSVGNKNEKNDGRKTG